MLTISLVTVIISAVVVVLAIVASLVNPFLRSLCFSDEEVADTDSPEQEVSGSESAGHVEATVLLTANDNLEELKRNLPKFLSQEYAANYQVVVVCQSTDGETIDYLKRMKAEHPSLYFTYIPESSRYMSRKKLQITLGVKAAKYEWIVLTEPSCCPQDNHWLEAMMRKCDNETDLVLGYVALEADTKGVRRFENIRRAFYLLRRAQRNKAYRTHLPNVAFRKSAFMQGQGFLGNLELVHGEYDFLVNKYAVPGKTAVELSPRAWLLQDEPTNKAWHNASLYLHASRKLLGGGGSTRTLMFFDLLLPHLSLVVSSIAIVYASIVKDWILLGVAIAAILLMYLLRMFIAKRAVNHFDSSLPAFVLPFYEYGVVWRSLADSLRYWRADKNDFTSHKI